MTRRNYKRKRKGNEVGRENVRRAWKGRNRLGGGKEERKGAGGKEEIMRGKGKETRWGECEKEGNEGR